MPSLEKAKIYEISAGDSPRTLDSGVEVQFNPESLSISLSNRIEGGRSAGRQTRQFVGSSSNTFSLDLEFDSADEGTTDNPVSVLEKTSVLDKFIQPKRTRGRRREQPAKLRFHWGHMIIDGVVENIDIELDHFAHNGYPLHAKVTIKIKEQKIEFQFAERGGGDAQGAGGDSEQVAQAMQGELPSEAASRLGLDPSNWRGLGFDAGLDLSLEAGLELSFDAELSASFGVDIKAGINADIDLSLEASLGLETGASISAPHLSTSSSNKDVLSSGLALTKSGGIKTATNIAQNNKAQNAASASVLAFSSESSAQSKSTNTANSISSRSVESTASRIRPARLSEPISSSVVARPQVTRIDKRASTYGFSVPLQDRRVPILDQQSSLRAYESRLPAVSDSHIADKTQSRRRPANRCGCKCGPKR